MIQSDLTEPTPSSVADLERSKRDAENSINSLDSCIRSLGLLLTWMLGLILTLVSFEAFQFPQFVLEAKY